MKQELGGRRFRKNEVVEMAIYEWLRMQKPISTATESLNSCQGGTNASMFSGILLKDSSGSVE
jgi:hypothetical protein